MSRTARNLDILMVASEALPFAKSGGLGDVMAALPLALGALGHRVTVVLPRYRDVEVGGATAVRLWVPLGSETYEAVFHLLDQGPGVRAALVDLPEFFDRPGYYGQDGHDYADNPRRFAFLARAALDLALTAARPVDIVHAHDWQAGLVPVFLRTSRRYRERFAQASSVFTLHNLAYQGLCAREWLGALGLGPELFGLDGLEFWGQLSFLKGGITFSDAVTTVSPGYAREITTPELGFGFDGVLRSRRDPLVGILNGIDDEVWNPSKDPHVPRPYGVGDLAGKSAAKRALLTRFAIKATPARMTRPLVAMIARMVDQKGLDLLAAVQRHLIELDATFVVMGEGDARYQEMWSRLHKAHPDRIGLRLGFDETVSHLIYAGADVFLMPSRFEPCGLSQMYCQRYGTLPVVHAVGGLRDTVEPVDARARTGTGFLFADYAPAAFLRALNEALALFRKPAVWRSLQRNAMTRDFSWRRSAARYLTVYRRALRGVRLSGPARGST